MEKVEGDSFLMQHFSDCVDLHGLGAGGRESIQKFSNIHRRAGKDMRS